MAKAYGVDISTHIYTSWDDLCVGSQWSQSIEIAKFKQLPHNRATMFTDNPSTSRSNNVEPDFFCWAIDGSFAC